MTDKELEERRATAMLLDMEYDPFDDTYMPHGFLDQADWVGCIDARTMEKLDFHDEGDYNTWLAENR